MNDTMVVQPLGKFGIYVRCTRTWLKWLAFLAMICDHIGFLFASPGTQWYTTLRLYIGRISFLIFAILFAEGFCHIKEERKLYHFWLLTGAVIVSEPCFDYMHSYGLSWFSYESQSVMCTFLIAYLMLWCMDVLQKEERLSGIVKLLMQYCIVGLFCLFAYFAKTDYSYYGVLCIAVCYFMYQLYLKQTKCISQFVIAFVVCMLLFFFTGKKGCLFAAIPFLIYDDSVKATSGKWFFYVGYPLHMLLLTAAGVALGILGQSMLVIK